MATENLFEKYGIKEVADVTIYRIEKKEETYESQRSITAKSIIKGAVELRTVYPFENGISVDEGFDAYVFTDANIVTGVNYDCDDVINTTLTLTGSFTVTETGLDNQTGAAGPDGSVEVDYSEIEETFKNNLEKGFNQTLSGKGNNFVSDIIIRDNTSQRKYSFEDLEDEGYELDGNISFTVDYNKKDIVATVEVGTDPETYEVSYTVTFRGEATATFTNNTDLSTGVYNNTGREVSDSPKKVGTHEYTYAEQAFMLFAKRQNLIARTGARYRFQDADTVIGNLAFEDAYALAPQSTDRVVVLGPAASYTSTEALPEDASWNTNNYDIQEINEIIDELTQVYTAKAYDIIYNNYAELVVEDEMGYFNPKFLGTKYNKSLKSVVNNFDTDYVTPQNYGKGKDIVLANATMWGEDEHYSINDAIDALRQQQKILDVNNNAKISGIKGLFGGYKVTGQKIPDIGAEDIDTATAIYKYSNGGNNIQNEYGDISSNYRLTSVLDALTTLSYLDAAIGKEIEVDYTSNNESNRAIYVNAACATTSARAHIYLLHNRNYRQLSLDQEGVFTFNDKNGNKLFYQDKIFVGTEWLALVIIGNKGLIFVVNRHGDTDIKKTAWMISNNGFTTDKQAEICVKNGLIHTIDIVANDETFEATCEVKKLNIRKITKKVNRYVPVLFLDTLKVSTLEQTAETSYATGGRGNSNLIGWDFGKTITLSLQDALFTPASMSLMFGNYEGSDFREGVKEAKTIDRTEKVTAKRSFIVPAGNQNGVPSEADKTAQAVFLDPNTMEPYQDGTPIAEGEVFLKWTRSIAYEGETLGHVIEISADKFPGTYKVVGETYIRSKDTGEDERFQFIIPQAKMTSEQTITLEADGEASVFDMNMEVLRPDDGIMLRLVQYNVVENKEENDGSKMVRNTENLDLLDDAELFKVSGGAEDEEFFIGATEY